MKHLVFLLLLATVCTTVSGQYSADENFSGRIRAGAGYAYDFPGLNGAGAYVEYSFPLNEWMQGGVGLRRIQTAGYPRTQTVREYTKATAIDFNLLFVPFHTDKAAFRIGTGYSFSFYSIRRSYPVYDKTVATGAVENTVWPQSDENGRTKGLSMLVEYEYNFSDNFSAGVKLALCKAYGSVMMGGPFVAIKL